MSLVCAGLPHDLIGRGSAGILGTISRRVPRDPSVFVVGTVGPASKKSRGLLPPLEKLQKLAELAAVVPADFDADLDEKSRSWLIRRRLSDEQVAELAELYRSGVGTPALAERFGMSKPSVLELLHDHGVRMRRQPLTKTQRARAVQLYERSCDQADRRDARFQLRCCPPCTEGRGCQAASAPWSVGTAFTAAWLPVLLLLALENIS